MHANSRYAAATMRAGRRAERRTVVANRSRAAAAGGPLDSLTVVGRPAFERK